MSGGSYRPLADFDVQVDAAAMGRSGFIAYGAFLTGATLLFAQPTIRSLDFGYKVSGNITALAIIGWLIASFAPIALSVLAWVIVPRLEARWRWLPHLIFIPLAVTVYGLGSRLYFNETGLLADSMASGFAMLIAMSYLSLALLVHLAAFAASGMASIARRRSNDS